MSKLLKVVFAAAMLITLSSYVLKVGYNSETEEKNQILMAMVIDYLENVHYQAEDLNDEFSEKAYSLYIKRLDYNKRIFLQEDIDELDKYKYAIDDEIKRRSFELFQKANDLQDKRMKEVEGLYVEILSTPFDFTIDENIEEDADKRSYAKNKAELREAWEKSLKYQTLTRLDRKLTDQDKLIANSDTIVEEKSIAVRRRG